MLPRSGAGAARAPVRSSRAGQVGTMGREPPKYGVRAVSHLVAHGRHGVTRHWPSAERTYGRASPPGVTGGAASGAARRPPHSHSHWAVLRVESQVGASHARVQRGSGAPTLPLKILNSVGHVGHHCRHLFRVEFRHRGRESDARLAHIFQRWGLGHCLGPMALENCQ